MNKKEIEALVKQREYFQNYYKFLKEGEMPKNKMEELQKSLAGYYQSVNPYLQTIMINDAKRQSKELITWHKDFIKINDNNHSSLTQQILRCIDIMEYNDFEIIIENENENLQSQDSEKIQELESDKKELLEKLKTEKNQNKVIEKQKTVIIKEYDKKVQELERIRNKGSDNWKEQWKNYVKDLKKQLDNTNQELMQTKESLKQTKEELSYALIELQSDADSKIEYDDDGNPI